MVFPFSFSNSIKVPELDNFESFKYLVLSEVFENFNTSKLANINKEEDKVSFSGAIFRFVWNGMNLFNGITSAKVQVSKKKGKFRIKYKICFLEMFAIAMFFTLLPFSVFKKTSQFWGLLGIIWGLFYFGTMIISIIRFHVYLNSIVNKSYMKIIREN